MTANKHNKRQAGDKWEACSKTRSVEYQGRKNTSPKTQSKSSEQVFTKEVEPRTCKIVWGIKHGGMKRKKITIRSLTVSWAMCL